MKKSFSLLLMSALLSGCATFSGDLPTATPTQVKDRSIYFELSFEQKLNGENLIPGALAKRNDLILEMTRQLEKTGYKIEEKKEKADESLSIHFVSEGSYSWIASTLSGITLTIIPSIATDKFTINATHSKNGKTNNFQVWDTSKTITSIFLLPAIPFINSETAHTKTISNMFNVMIFEINKP